jgi:2-polyprenyl-3-methyl-5-hydroxy-6-metoxy-1,4-benzoquinol methylase
LSTRSREGEFLRTVICKQCGLVWSDPFPITPSNYYEKDYRIKYKGVYTPRIKHVFRAANVAISRYKKIKNYLNGKKDVLDIGSGGGEFLYLISRMGFNAQGVEPNEGYGNYSQTEYGLNVKVGFIQNSEFDDNSFDLITMWHVLEHTDNPSNILMKVHSWLRDSGLLVIEVPNVEATCQSPKSTFHAAHLFNFNADTLSLLLGRTGFSVVHKTIAKDGGNIFLIANKTDSVNNQLSIDGNYKKIQGIVKRHTIVSHYLSHFPYSRFLRKIFKIVTERKASKKFSRGKQVLDSCFSNPNMHNRKILSAITCRIIGLVYDRGLRSFPKTVRIEITNACNSQCIICPHHKMTRTINKMDESMFFSIIDECAENGCNDLHLHNIGEPFLDKRLEQFVAYSKKKGIKKVKIFSNGSLITSDRARRILNTGLDEINVCFDGASKEEFEDIRRPLKFDEVVKNIVGLVNLRNELGGKTKIRIACCSTSDKSKTLQMLESIVDGYSFGKVHNWGTEAYITDKTSIRKPCSRIWQTFTVLANADVSLCCLDYDGQIILGHIETSKNSITSIWKNNEYKKIRSFHKRGKQKEIKLCSTCSKSFV